MHGLLVIHFIFHAVYCDRITFQELQIVYKVKNNPQLSILDFDQPLGLHMNPENRWIKLAKIVPWDRYEAEYARYFKSHTGNVAKPFRMVLGALIIQKKYGYSDRELVEVITENPYLQYFIGLPGYQETPPFDATTLVSFRKRIDIDMTMVMNEMLLAQEQMTEQDTSDRDHDDHDNDHHDGPDDGSGGSAEDSASADDNSGTLILDATRAPSNIRFPQDFSLLNEAREKLEKMVRRICHDNGEKMPRTYCREARKNYLNLAKSKKRTAQKIRKVIRKQLGYVNRDLGYIDQYLDKGCKFTNRELTLLDTIRKVYEQQKYMYDNYTHSVENRIVSISQPYIRPIVRGKAKAPVEFGIRFDLSLDEKGYGRIERHSFEAYNESSTLMDACESYKKRTGHYPERILADQIYRNRENRAYCREHGIRLSGPKLGRPSLTETSEDRRKAYQDNTDRIEVERSFSLCKRCFGLGLVTTKLEKTAAGSIGLSVLTMNLFRILSRQCLVFFTFFKELVLCAMGHRDNDNCCYIWTETAVF